MSDIERTARQAIREMAQATDRGYTREEVLVTFLQAERRLALEAAVNICDHWGPSTACSAEIRALGEENDS